MKVHKKATPKRSSQKNAVETRQQPSVAQQVKPATSVSLSPTTLNVAPTVSLPGPALRKEPPPGVLASTKPAPLPALPPAVNIIFATYEPLAERVTLAGEFNNWSPDTLPLKRQADGHWQAVLTLSPGRYQYKFVVDGQWMPDLNAQEHQFNPYGTLNSVIEVRQ